MTMHKNSSRGSAVLLVIALLVLMAMIGSLFLLTNYMDRREAVSLSRAAPMKTVALSVVGQVQIERAIDLHFDASGTVYGLADTVAKTIDYASEETDPVLASSEMETTPANAQVWPHLSNPAGLPASAVQNVVSTDTRLVCADGFGQPNAVPYDSGILDADGRHYFVGAYVTDASARLNVNLALGNMGWIHPSLNQPMNATDLSAQVLCNDVLAGDTSYFNLQDYRTGGPLNNTPESSLGGSGDAKNLAIYYTKYGLRPLNVAPSNDQWHYYIPFTMSDMLGLVWGGDPDTSGGRLYEVLHHYNTPVYDGTRRFLTTWSSERTFIVPRLAGMRPQKVKAELNPNLSTDAQRQAALSSLYNAFYNSLPGNSTADEATRRRTAAQLAVNAIDFADTDDNVTVARVDPASGDVTLLADNGATVAGDTAAYGTERQMFVTEVFLKKVNNAGVFVYYSAIELFNPYLTAVPLPGLRMLVDGVERPLTNAPGALAPKGRMVLRSHSAQIPVYVTGAPATVIVEAPDLNLARDIKLLRARSAAAGSIGDVVLGSAGNINIPDAEATTAAFRTYQWNDSWSAWAPKKATYTINRTVRRSDNAHDYTTSAVVGGTRTAGNTNLGAENCSDLPFADPGGESCPLYVRNSMFLNVGELLKLFCVGPVYNAGDPKASQSLPDRLTATDSIANGKLPYVEDLAARDYGAGNIPVVPVGCLLQDYLMVNSPMADGVDNDNDQQIDKPGEERTFAKININTVPGKTMRCIPGIIQGGGSPGYGAVNDIIAYRDGTQYLGTRNFVSRAAALTMPSLRMENGKQGPGIASLGEVALVTKPNSPNNSYGVAPGLPYNQLYVNDGSNTSVGEDLDGVNNDMLKYYMNYVWMSNHITVRSDVFVVNLAVMGSLGTTAGNIGGLAGNTLTDSSKNWGVNQLTGLTVMAMTSNGWQANRIVSNTANSLTVAGGWPTSPVAGSAYQVLSVRRYYAAVIDRGNCRSLNDVPTVLMFAEMK